MPSPKAYWLIASPLVDNDPGTMMEQLKGVVDKKGLGDVRGWNGWAGAEVKTASLSSLLTLSETLSKADTTAVSAVSKIVETIRTLVNTPSASSSAPKQQIDISKHLVMDDGVPYEEYVFSNEATAGGEGWHWNRGKWRADGRKLEEVVDQLVKDITAVDNIHKSKLQSYTIAKGQLAQLQRKKVGNLATRSLNEVLDPSDFSSTRDSEYLDYVLVAVPKNNLKDFTTKYERLTSMVVPRSAVMLAEDDEFSLYSVVVFRKVKDEFSQKCRENKFIPRDYNPDPQVIAKQKKEFEELEKKERELWSDLLRLSRLNFAESFQLLVHIKFLRTYVESVLRYGLPADYFYAVIRPEPRQSKKLISTLQSHFEGVVPHSNEGRGKKKGGGAAGADQLVGEFAQVMEDEWMDLVVFDIERFGEEE
ncbi:putative VMA5-H+-ATPase V1 domain 42 kd subunit, vacuolar [Atractiella rhizophila]|nr:putative VMA5-H+-ATPase V1 domain 42 kd subunit, vacuolar [Atractiella rhizophila]